MQIVMANDPHRDYLPVKEYSGRSGRGSNERFDHQFLSKLPRCELEDKVHRLLDEQTQLKKLLNSQEEKIKRLGTKLLRIIGEKKNGKKSSENTKESEELSLRITELEHENYSLKDKNTVLKQQLASHSQGAPAHRSPARATPQYSIYMSTRHSQGPLQSEAGFDSASKNDPTEAQLQAAEAHIRELNEEIKSLHLKIDSLQQNLEKNSLDNRKTKVAENIELIRLQRSLKQQAIQISALQDQVINSENNQKILKEELLKAHNENEEALQLISLKQNEILNLCSKLEETNLNRLEESELRERIKDLTKERDFLKERCDQLLEKISGKRAESQQLEELKQLLLEEKEKKADLEDLVEEYQMCLAKKFTEEDVPHSKEPLKEGGDSLSKIGNTTSKLSKSLMTSEKTIKECTDEEEQQGNAKNEEPGAKSGSLEGCLTLCECSQIKLSNTEQSKAEYFHQVAENLGMHSKEKDAERVSKHCLCKIQEEKYYAEKMKLERELQYLREMLRSQTARCEVQQAEISRLMYELRLNEDKCNDTLRKLDLHLKIFQHFDTKTRENETPPEGVELRKKSNTPAVTPTPTKVVNAEANKIPSREEIRSEVKSKDNSTYDSLESESKSNTPLRRHTKKSMGDTDTKKRFVDQVFLESSDEENVNEKSYDRESFIKKLEELGPGGSQKETNENDFESPPSWPTKASVVHKKTSPENFLSDSSLLKTQTLPVKKISEENQTAQKNETIESPNQTPFVKIMINWLQADTSKSVWKDEKIKLIFIDFSFLDVKGEETETPDSLPKPKKPQDVCVFNFTKRIDISDGKRKILNSLLNRSELALIVFKCVSDPENTAEECEDFGVAEVTVKEFLEKSGRGPFQIPLKNMNNLKEVIGKLNISIETSADLHNVTT